MAEKVNNKKIERNTYGVDEKLEQEFNFSHLKRSLKYVKKYAWKLALAMVLAFFATVITLLGPQIVGLAIDEGMTEGGAHYGDTGYLFMLGGLYLGCMVTAGVLTAIRSIMVTKVGQSIVLDIRSDLFHHLQKLPFSYYDSRPQGKILVRVTSYVANVSDLLSNGIVNAVIDVITIIVIAVFMLTTNIKLTIPVLCGLPILLLVLFIIKPAQRKAHQVMSNKRSNLTAYTCENIEGVRVTEMFDREEKNKEIYRQLTRDYSNSWIKAIRISLIIPLATENITCWAQMGVYAVAFYLFGPAGIGVGVIIAMASYASRFWNPISNLATIYNNLITTLAYLERIFETITLPLISTTSPMLLSFRR